MLTFYIATAAIGGILALIGAFVGDHGHEVQVGADIHDVAHTDGHDGDVWIPFFSVRFWTYFAMAFGLCGLLLTLWVKQSEPNAAILSGVCGLILGLSVAYIVRILSRTENTSTVTETDLIGLEGQITVAIRPGQLGRVRVAVKGEIIELLAKTDDVHDLEIGSNAVVVDLIGDYVKVVARQDIYGSPNQLNAQ